MTCGDRHFQRMKEAVPDLKGIANFDRLDRKPLEEPGGIFLAARTPHNYGVIAERLSNLAVEKTEEMILKALQIVEPRLVSLRVQYRGGLPLIFGKNFSVG